MTTTDYEQDDDSDLCQDMCDAMATLTEVIKAHPKEMHGSMCIGAFRELQMDVRPAPAPGLWNTPAPPEPRQLLSNIGEDGIYLDEQMRQFAWVVVQMVADYPEDYRALIIGDFHEELRLLMATV